MISPDPEREAEHLQFLGSVDTILVGHGVYHDMVGYWPTATGELADRINATPKVVVSTTAEELAWQNARPAHAASPSAFSYITQPSAGAIPARS